ncbi:MAG: hypothetical protein IJR99_05090 [Kiritimatiellae bacterium]|nr:hypothetical protein [Kiritimatiellia bacterium]
MRRMILRVCAFACVFVCGTAAAFQAKIDGRCVVFDCPSAGTFRIECQRGNATLSVSEGRVRFQVADAKPNQMLLSMLVPTSFISGGGWRVDEREGAFPFALGASEKLFQGNGREIAVRDLNKESLALGFPVGTYFEVQDNRKWNWNTFEYRIFLPAGMMEWEMTYSFVPAAGKARLLDRFGQVSRDFPGKISEESELKADVKSEDGYYRSLDFAGKLAAEGYKLDAFGGILGTGMKFGLKHTGYFHLEKLVLAGGGTRWFLVDPAGNAFFHLGVCVFGGGDDLTDVTGREDAYEWIPPHEGAFAAAWKTDESYWSTRAVSHYRANLVRKYGSFDITATALRNIARVRQAGFNSMGAFGEVPDAARQAYFPYVKILPLSGVRKIPTVRGVFDPYDPETVRAVEGAMESVRTDVNSALLIGYFLENEQAMEAIPRAIPALDDSWAAKRAFQASGKSPEDFAVEFLEKYYSLIVKTFRACDPHHLLIGNRWMPSTADREALCRVAGRYLDAISINYYTREVDPAFARRIYEWSGGKPQIWSEFFYSAGKEANTRPFTFDLPTQRERGMTYRRYVKTAASLGFVVGTEWFTLVDQSATGRFFQGKGGESYNTGLLSVTDRPYRDLWKEMRDAHLEVVGLFLP